MSPRLLLLSLLISACLAQPSFAVESIKAGAVDSDNISTNSGATVSNTEVKRSKQKTVKTIQRDDNREVSDDEEKRTKDALEIARQLGISSDDARPEQQWETSLFGKRMIVGGELNTSVRGRRDYDLVRGAKDDDVDVSPEATLEAIWLPSETTVAFASAKGFTQATVYKEGGGANTQSGATLNELWLLKTGLFNTPYAAQFGRQKVQDRRKWWWDENLDAARLHYFGSKVTAFIGVGENSANFSTQGRVEPKDKGQRRVFANLDWEWSKRQNIELFGLRQNDRTKPYAIGELVALDSRDDRDADLTWFGVRARGCVKPKMPRRICYWGDVARMRGTEIEYDFNRSNNGNDIVDGTNKRKLDGWAYDVGLSIELPLKSKPYLSLGHARGSSDRPGTPGLDGAFRQTGLHKNDGKFRGLSRFRYYGEVLRPDLSNIAINTVAVGVPVGEYTWVESIWHSYRQPVADKRIAGSRLNKNPNGINKNLGEEFDLVISHRPSSRWEFELTAGAFRAGPAFGKEVGRVAGLIEFKLDYNF